MDIHELPLALTYDDVLIVPQRSGIRSRSQVSLASRLTTDIEMGTPVIAANMDTVCGWEMAATMSQLGAAGIIHRFLPIADQQQEVIDGMTTVINNTLLFCKIRTVSNENVADFLNELQALPQVFFEVDSM